MEVKQNRERFRCNYQRVAVLSDIHSNVWALKACLTDAQKAGADCFVFLGDYVSGLSAPTQTMDLIYALREQYPTCCIRGNRERYMMDHRDGVQVCVPGSRTGSLLYTYRQLREKDLALFTALPYYDVIEINGVVLEIAHATKEQDRYLFEKGDDKIAGVIAQMEADYLLCGHSHIQYRYRERGKTVLNPGSVGQPQGADYRAQYLLLEVGNGTVSCDFRLVDYDVEPMVRDQFQSGLVELGRYWAISDLYGALTGQKCTRMLLEKMYAFADPDALQDEQLWHAAAVSLGMRFTEEEILLSYQKRFIDT